MTQGLIIHCGILGVPWGKIIYCDILGFEGTKELCDILEGTTD
jgi:hypothetical protein